MSLSSLRFTFRETQTENQAIDVLFQPKCWKSSGGNGPSQMPKIQF